MLYDRGRTVADGRVRAALAVVVVVTIVVSQDVQSPGTGRVTGDRLQSVYVGEGRYGPRMNKGDLATWVSAGVAFFFSLIALIVSIRALRWQREGAEIAKRAQEFMETRHAEEQAKAAGEARRVRWDLDRLNKITLVLRNVTPNPATGVRIDGDQFKGFGRDLPNNAGVSGYASVQFNVLSAAGAQFPNEVWVTWDGQEDPVALPVPPW
jgi:hypothetical protein